jgi:hypothetical protein
VNRHADGTTTPSSFRREAVHIVTLWSFAVAQPLYEIVRRNREFFVAHRSEPYDLLLLVATLSVVLPGLLVGGLAAARLISARAGRVFLLTAIGAFAACIAAQPLAHDLPLPPVWHYAAAAAIGIGAAILYMRWAPLRLFVTVLTPAIVVFPAILLLHPDMATFVRPDGRTAKAAGRIPADAPPIVMVVFDQLPLTSLMNERGEIDAANFPAFASLAGRSTWYRNASTVADYTGFAIPPIVSGLRPRPRRLPIANDYPDNLFTFLAGTYKLEVFESITGLCPERLCPRERLDAVRRLGAMVADLGVVYLHVVFPEAHRARLPSLTEDWRDFAQGQNWHRRWVAERDDDRRRAPREFIKTLSRSDPQPTLYFLHALLPHEPYVYLPSGQQFTSDPRLIGLIESRRWVRDDWAVAEQQRRHLIQLRYVDRIVGQLVDRLKSEGLYDRSLLVVTADHGVGFRPGHSFKTVLRPVLADITSVPLFIKAPGQTEGQVSDRNVESPDIVPTIADAVGAELTWTPDGTSLLRAAPERPLKTVHHNDARSTYPTWVVDFVAQRDAAVARKAELFGRGPNPFWLPATTPFPELIGRTVESLDVAQGGDLHATVDDVGRLANVDLRAPVLPAQLTGRVLDEKGRAAQAVLAIALNGTIAAMTRTHGFLRGDLSGTWTALVNPERLRTGRNDVEVLVVRRQSGLRLERAYSSAARPDMVNVLTDSARHWGIRQSGFHPPEGDPPFRWTSGRAVVTVPIHPTARPRALRLVVSQRDTAASDSLRVAVNRCTLFEGRIDADPWYRTWPLQGCPAAVVNASEARIEIESQTHADSRGRRVGVAVEALHLFTSEWPAAPDGDTRVVLRPVHGPGREHARGSAAQVEVLNEGKSVLFSPGEAPDSGVELELRWKGAREPQRLPLSRTIFPRERLVTDIPLQPPAELEGRQPWTLQIVPVRRGGRVIPIESPCELRVVEDR